MFADYCSGAVPSLSELSGAPDVRLLEAAGFTPLVSTDDTCRFTVECPVCGGQAKVSGDRAQCTCPLGDCRILDLAARRTKGHYTKALALLEQGMPALAGRERWQNEGRQHAATVQTLRWLTLVARGVLKPRRTADVVQAEAWTKSHGLGTLLETGAAVVLDATMVDAACRACDELPCGKPALAITYWLDPVTPVAVLFMGPGLLRRVDLLPHCVAVAGLHLSSDRRLLAASVADQAKTGHASWVSGKGDQGPSCPLVVQDHGRRQDWLAWGRLYACCPRLTIEHGGHDLSPLAWLRTQLLRLTTGDLWPGTCSILLDCMNPPREHMEVLLTAIRNHDRHRAASVLRGRMLDAVLHAEGKLSLKRDGAGYHAWHRDDKTSRQITNFSLEPRHNVVYPDTADLEHVCLLDLPGSTTEITIGGKDLATASKLQEALRACAAQHRTEILPTILDQPLANKLVLGWLRRRVSGLDQVTGKSAVGWTLNRTLFQAPGWQVAAGGCTETHVVLRSDIPALACFDGAPQPSALPEGDLPGPASDLLAIIAALVARYFVRMQTRAVAWQSTPDARALCRAVFAGFGQTREIELTSFRNSGIPGVNGYPVLAAGYTEAQAVAAAYPAVFLAENGHVPGPVDPERLPAVTAASRWMLQHLTGWLLDTGGSGVLESRAFKPMHVLLAEGAALLRGLTGKEWPVSAPACEALRAFVSGIDPDAPGTALSATDKWLNLHNCPDAGKVAEDLVSLGVHAAAEDTRVSCLLVPAVTLLHEFWGKAPAVEQAVPA